MSVIVGDVETFPHIQADKEQVKKVLEEAAEVYSAWEEWLNIPLAVNARNEHLIDECADLITATCNLLAALGVTDMRDAMAGCAYRNHKRGRL